MTGAHAFAAGGRLRKLGKTTPPSADCQLLTAAELQAAREASVDMTEMGEESEAIKRAEDALLQSVLGFEVSVPLYDFLLGHGAPGDMLAKVDRNQVLHLMVHKSMPWCGVAVGQAPGQHADSITARDHAAASLMHTARLD